MMSLRWKLTWQISLLIISLCLMGAAALWGLNGLNQNFGVALQGYQQLRKLYEIGSHVQAARMLMSISHPEAAKARSELQRARAMFDLDFPIDDAKDPAERDMRKSVITALDLAMRSGDSPDELDASAITNALGPLVALDVHNRQMIETAQNQAQRKRILTMYWMAGFSIGVAVLALGIGIAQYTSVVPPLRRLKLAVARVAAGRFKERVPETGSVEFAELAKNFNRMAIELENVYRDLQQKVDAKSKELLRNERLASVGFLAAGVAHEINNPLSIITAHAELSMQMLEKKQPVDPNEFSESLDVIYDEAFRCKRIVEKLLSLAKAPEEQAERFSLGDLAKEVAKTVAALPEYKNRNITVAASGNDSVTGRRGEINQVILNLLFNALQATNPGGEVRVTLTRAETTVELSIRDNGKGMTPQMLDRIFEPFYTDPLGKAEDSHRGTGLGLSITHAIIQRHNGSIRAESDGPGKGSTFLITLPATATEEGA
jgi:two-component system NtrC family sensor kinase